MERVEARSQNSIARWFRYLKSSKMIRALGASLMKPVNPRFLYWHYLTVPLTLLLSVTSLSAWASAPTRNVSREPLNSTDSQPAWWPGFFTPGTDEAVSAILETPEKLIIGGSFHHVGDQPADLVASWDGTSWESMSIPFEGGVSDLALFNGELLASGRFSWGQSTYWLLKWDGETWQPVGDQLGGQAAAIAVYRDTLYVVGNFWGTDFQEHDLALRWDGHEWEPMRAGLPQNFGIGGNTAAVFGDRLMVGGGIRLELIYSMPIVFSWDGTSWKTVSLDSTTSGDFLGVRDLAVHEGNLYVAGKFAKDSTVFPNGVGIWDSGAWKKLGNGLPPGPDEGGRVDNVADAFALFSWKEALLVGGRFFTTAETETTNGLARWDGSSWTSVGSGIQYGGVFALGEFEGALVAGGSFNVPGGGRNLALWNGSIWSTPFLTGAGLDGPILEMAVFNNNLLAGGMFQHAGRLSAPGVASWNGVSWSPLGTGVQGLVEAMVPFGNTLVVGGQFNSAGGNAAINVASWNGTEWKALGSGLLGRDVMALAVHNGTLYAGGDFSLSDNDCCIAQWDGTDWRSVGGGLQGDSPYVAALASFNGDLIVGGWFRRHEGTAWIPNLARWNGVSWRGLGGYPQGGVTSLLNFHSQLFVAGYFQTIYDIPNIGYLDVNHIGVWSGFQWQSLGSGMDDDILDLDVFHDNLIAVGYFDKAGTGFAARAATWDGSAWSGFSTGPTGIVWAVEPFQNHLFIGGGFGKVGDTPSSGIARWDESPQPLTAANFEATRDGHDVHLSWESPTPGREFQILRESGGVSTLLARLSSQGNTTTYVDAHAPDSRANYWLGEIDSESILGWIGPAVAAPREFHFAFPHASPNPFTATMQFVLEIEEPEWASLRIYDISGREVARLLDGFIPAGEHHFYWDGKSQFGGSVPAGIFFARLETASGSRVQKLVKIQP